MRVAFRILLWLLLGSMGLALAAAALAWHLAARSLPDYGRDWRVDGLSRPVEIVRDAYAVPHIVAETDADAFFALGWAHAQDRLWQMELQRRTAGGRLAELFGRDALPIDRTMRALDLVGFARAAVDRQTPETRALLEAYAEGVNARIRAVNEGALGRGAPEFFVYADAIAPWTPTDSLALVKLMALRVTTAASSEARRLRLLSMLTPEQLADLDPDYPEPGVLALPAPQLDIDGLSTPGDRAEAPRHPLSPFAPIGLGGASNVFAVSAERSASGAPLLATDPHLWLSAPSVWSLARLRSPGFDVIGATIPGIPAVIIGRNARVAWGITTAQVDDQDIFLERVDPENPDRFLTPEGWAAFDQRETVIRIRGGEREALRLKRTANGPVMPPDGDLSFASVTPDGHVAALAWTALTAEDRSIEAAHRLMRARSIEDGVAAAALHLAPAQNLALADASGVAMVVAGAIPLRREDSRTQGRTPSLGWVRENQWEGLLPAEEAPRAIRPLSGAVANANNRTTNAPFPRHLSFDWAEPYRLRRIERLLNDRAFHTRESFAEIQNDTVSEMARAVLPLIAREMWWGETTDDGPVARRRAAALRLLADWNGDMSMHDPEPLIFAAWMRALTRRLIEDETGPLFRELEGPRPLLVERVFRDVDGAARWCDVVMTPEVESCADMARRALDDALAELTARFGGQPEQWRWGAAHRARHVHAPLGFNRLLGLIFNIEHESSGGDHTINVGGMRGRGADPYANVHAAGFRAIYDFADLDRSLHVIATGQSGHFLSRHYDDLGAMWRRGDYAPMSLSLDDARAGAVGVSRLSP
ncbi:MAG: penicillin acylase family protein [Rhodobacteraceae bacterium]|nr:MAG: penicillin acylase family protein [Paracoccaceae bacterium]